jgi:hypothetical protein
VARHALLCCSESDSHIESNRYKREGVDGRTDRSDRPHGTARRTGKATLRSATIATIASHIGLVGWWL